MATGLYRDSEARAQAVLWRERMIQRAADRGMDPDALWLEERPNITGPAPDIAPDDIDIVLERLRSGRTTDVPARPVLELLRAQGGVALGSPLAVGLKELGVTARTAPGLFRRDGITDADRVMVAEHPVLADNDVEADANGHASHDGLMAAIAREVAGDPLRTHEQRTLAARLDQPVTELRRMVEAADLDPATVTRADLRTLMQRQAASGQALGQDGKSPGPFGPIFTEFKGDAQGAIAKLMEVQDGEAIGALHHPEIGDIDLVWGQAGDPAKDYQGGYGLAHIAAKHPEMLGDLQGLLSGMAVAKRTTNRVNLESADHRAAVRLAWDDQTKQWLLTAFVKEDAKDGGAPRTDTNTETQLDGSPDAHPSDGSIDQTLRDFYQSTDTGPRGQYDPVSNTIRLFQSRNLSTFTHESGHAWLFQMVHDLGDQRLTEAARARITADLRTVLDWLKVDVDVDGAIAAGRPDRILDHIPVEAHEQWARGFEAYVMEGRQNITGPAPDIAPDDIDIVMERLRSGRSVDAPARPVLELSTRCAPMTSAP